MNLVDRRNMQKSKQNSGDSRLVMDDLSFAFM